MIRLRRVQSGSGGMGVPPMKSCRMVVSSGSYENAGGSIVCKLSVVGEHRSFVLSNVSEEIHCSRSSEASHGRAWTPLPAGRVSALLSGAERPVPGYPFLRLCSSEFHRSRHAICGLDPMAYRNLHGQSVRLLALQAVDAKVKLHFDSTF